MDVTLGRWVRRGDDIAGARASVGRPTWGPAAFLADLELRLGMASLEADDTAREVVMLARTRTHVAHDSSAFFARSLDIDPTGTAAVLLAMRDELVEAGWAGEPVVGGGQRLAAMAAMEAGEPLPTGRADRVAAVARELAFVDRPVVDRLSLLESLALWPGAWQRIIERLPAIGTTVDASSPQLPGAPAETNLGRAQRALAGIAPAPQSGKKRPLRRDDTLIQLRAATSWELGEATASLLRVLVPTDRAGSICCVRVGDAAPLDAALASQGLRSQGVVTTTSLRPGQQLLPLALALLFLPRDVHRALELLSLPLCPVPGRARSTLLRALSEAAGVGSRAWTNALAELTDDERAVVAAWIEPVGVPRTGRAPRERVLEIVDRVRNWAQGRRALDREPRAVDGLIASVAALRSAVEADPRQDWAQHELEEELLRYLTSTMPGESLAVVMAESRIDLGPGATTPSPR